MKAIIYRVALLLAPFGSRDLHAVICGVQV